jgi:hypothetical protein
MVVFEVVIALLLGNPDPDYPLTGSRHRSSRQLLSQNGAFFECGQRHIATRVSRRMIEPSAAFTTTSPRI